MKAMPNSPGRGPRLRWAYLIAMAIATALAVGCGNAAELEPLPAPATVAPSPTASPSAPAPTAVPNPTAVQAQASDDIAATPTATVSAPTPTPTPTSVAATTPTVPTPRPTETPAPTPTATAVLPAGLQLPEIDSLAAEAMALLEEITSEISPRESATDQELEAARFLSAKFESLGYEVFLESFEVRQTVSDVQVSSEEVTAPGELRTIPINLSVEASASGPLTSVGMAFEEDIPAGGLMGRVALIERGTITFQSKVRRVAEAGAVAAIVFNNRDGLFGGAFAEPSSIPAVSLSRDAGRNLLALMEAGEVVASVTVETRTLQSRNVVAEKPGPPGNKQVIVLGGHYDTVPGTPGANDNGAGIATVLTIAGAIADRSYPFMVRFMLFGSEELGLLGSSNYVRALSDEQRLATLAMLNFDSLATGDTLGVLGDGDLALKALSIARELGISSARRQFGISNFSSDHAPFVEAGIPTVFFLADDISRIHTPEDTLEFVQPELLGGSAVLGIALLAVLSEG